MWKIGISVQSVWNLSFISFSASCRLLGIDVVEGKYEDVDFSTKEFSGALVQYPDINGEILDFSAFVDMVHQYGVSR